MAVIGRHFLRADAVLPDNVAGGEAIARHLLGLGHRAIAVSAGSAQLTTIEDRLTGISRALREHGMVPASVPMIHTTFDRDGSQTAADEILHDHPATTAIIALNDAMAMGVLSTLRRRRIAVPTQMSVAGFDDVAVAADLAPSLTTVRLPMTRMGELALMMALKPSATRPRRKATGHDLMVRDSTGPVPTG